MSKRIYILGILLLFVAAVSSCRIKEMEPGHSSSTRPLGGKIAFEIGTAQSVVPQTKGFAGSQQGTKSFVCVEGQDSLYLACTVVDNNDPVYVPDAPAVKGLPVTSENMTSFYVAANLTPQLKYFPLTLVNESRKSENVYTLDYYWPQNSLDFYAANFYPSRENIIFGYDEDGTPTGTFSYTLPKPDNNFNDAAAQPDYAFAIAQGLTEEEVLESNDGIVPLKFSHCLTSVTFKIGSQFMDPEGRVVEKVEIIGVPSSGICTFHPDQNGDMVYAWNTEESDLETYAQKISDADETATNIANNQIINNGELTFMLIPYDFSDSEAKIRITFKLHSDREEHKHTFVLEKDIYDLFADSAPKEWYPGKKYIYTIVGEEVVEIDFEVEDEFINDDTIIGGDFAITNTGNSPVYVRAYIVGWWEDETGIHVAPWTVTDGKFTGTGWANDGFTFSGEGSDWKIGPDGFFYYQKVLSPNETASKLFDTYTLTADPPVLGAKLVLNVVTQAILHYRVNDSEVWQGMIGATNSTTQSEGYIYDSLNWK